MNQPRQTRKSITRRGLPFLPLLLSAAWGCSAPSDATEEIGQTEHELVSDDIPQIYTHYYKLYEGQKGRTIDISTKSNEGNRAYGAASDLPVNNQLFAVIPVAEDSNWFYLVPKHRGGVLDISSSNDAYMSDAYPHAGYNQMFYVQGNNGTGYFNIRTPARNGVLDVSNTARRNNQLYLAGTATGGGNQSFLFVPTEEFPYPAPQPSADGRPLGDVPRLRSLADVPPLESEARESVARIPFVYVKNDGSRAYQAQTTPYYKLVLKRFWRRVALGEKFAGLGMSQTYTVEHGMSQTSSRQLQSTLNFVVKANGALDFPIANKLKGTLGISLERQLSVTTTESNSVTFTNAETKVETLTWPTEVQVRWAVWHMVDSYTLQRMDDSTVSSWELVYESNKIVDSFRQ